MNMTMMMFIDIVVSFISTISSIKALIFFLCSFYLSIHQSHCCLLLVRVQCVFNTSLVSFINGWLMP